MTIDFHDAANANTYASREAHADWFTQMSSALNGLRPGEVVDVGCGGGIYSRAWHELGAHSVIGIDSSEQMIEDARAATDDGSIRFSVATAYETGLASASCDIVFSRAVVHHLSDLRRAMIESRRILKPGGILIVQDRTIEDVSQPASAQHFRAEFFTPFPKLLDLERKRRPSADAFGSLLQQVGFSDVAIQSFWETRKIYQTPDSLRKDLLARTGRSILHHLTDEELATLTESILLTREKSFPLEERDRWTMWTAVNPVDL